MSERDNSFLAFVVGGIIGAAIGILYAPKAGKETRSDLRRMGEELSDTVTEFKDDLTEKGRRVYKEGRQKILLGKDKITEAFEEGKRAFEKYKNED